MSSLPKNSEGDRQHPISDCGLRRRVGVSPQANSRIRHDLFVVRFASGRSSKTARGCAVSGGADLIEKDDDLVAEFFRL